MIHMVGNVAVYIAAASAALFCVLYHLTASWRRSLEGRFLMSFIFLHAVVFGWISYRVAVASPRPLPVVEEVIRTAVFGSCAGFLTWALVLLWHRQIRPGMFTKRGR